jgi:hypothetical protein
VKPLAIREIAILFARADSIYKSIPGCDVWDAARDARKWPGGSPIVAHPPCRLWGRLRRFANVVPGEKELATWAVEKVREYGGVLEHPHGSLLWRAMNLPRPGARDEWSGWTAALPQFWLGHKAEKASWFYIVGVEPDEVSIPFRMGEADFVIQTRKRFDYRPHVPKADRERTPLEAAKWLIEIARKVSPHPDPLISEGGAVRADQEEGEGCADGKEVNNHD